MTFNKSGKYIFDLDDTLIRTHLHPEWRDEDYTHLKFSAKVLEMLNRIGRENLILLTLDKYGNQRKKLDYLQVEKYFTETILATGVEGKKQSLQILLEKYGDIVVVGDRYHEGELSHALELGIPTVCVAINGGNHYDSTHHHKHVLLIEEEKDFDKL